MSNIYYARTTEGQAAAYDATSALPRKLKSLLKVIDGKTSHDVFASSLKAFGDVQGLLTSLKKAGLIELRHEGVEAVASVPQASAQPQVSLATALAGKFGFSANRRGNTTDGFALTQTALTQPQTILETRVDTTQRQQHLQLLVQDMSSFVLAYVPEQAFNVLSELEQINSMEQLAVLMGGYELMLQQAGEPAQIHLLHVRQVLGKWL